jgi:hypothetical protein
VKRKTHYKEEPRKTMARLSKATLVDGKFYNFFVYNKLFINIDKKTKNVIGAINQTQRYN